MKTRFPVLIARLLLGTYLVVGCAAAPPTPDAAATEAAIAAKIFATLTAAPPAPTPAATATPAPPTLPPPTLTVAPSPTPVAPTVTPTQPPATPSPTERPSPSATPQSPQAIVQSAVLNVRAGPGTTHAVVSTTKQGDSLPVIGRNNDGSWLQVTLPDSRSGWIAASLAQVNVPANKVAVAGVIPTPPPAVAQPAGGKRDLEVTFINPHYDCKQGEWSYTGDDGKKYPMWGYRRFQVDMYVKNNSKTPVEPPWRPKRWIITDGHTDVISGLMWQWVSRRSGFYEQPTIQPGQSAGWTFMAFPIDRTQWLKAVEFVWNGQVYRQEFDLGQFGNAHNYKDCGDPRPHTFRPTPTPRP